MGDSTGNSYFSGPASRFRHSRPPSSLDEQNILPHLLAPLRCEADFQPYLGAGGSAQNISVQFMHSCSGQDTTQLDSDILQRRLSIDEESPSEVAHPIGYPESSQRTTSHALSPYPGGTSRFSNFPSCDLPALDIVDAPLHGTQGFRRGSWPTHSQMAYSSWMHSQPRMFRSPASEPPESTSDESFQDSDAEETTHMSPMMNEFQVQSTRSLDPSLHHMHRAQALQPSVMTFQLSETMLQPVDDPENRHVLRSLLDMNIVAGDGSDTTHPSPSPAHRVPLPSPISFAGATLQGPGMRIQQDGEKVTRTSQFRVPASTRNSVPFPSSHSHMNSRAGDQRSPGAKPQKKSKMHQCEMCKKLFPRPSGLATHMNTHSGAKPYKCIIPSCEKRFAVRSNAKRHLRTHGIDPAADALSMPRYTVGFEEPMVTQVHDAGKQPLRYRWIPQNQSPQGDWSPQGSSSSAITGRSATGLTFQTSMSSMTSTAFSVGSDDDYDEDVSPSGADVDHYQQDYDGSTDEFSGTHSRYRGHSG